MLCCVLSGFIVLILSNEIVVDLSIPARDAHLWNWQTMTTIDWNYVQREQSANNSAIKAVVALLHFNSTSYSWMECKFVHKEGGRDQKSVSVSIE